jgi:type IV pilus assembly protein PilO
MNISFIKEQPWYLQLGLFLLGGGLIVGLFWYFVISGINAEIKELDAKVTKLKQENVEATIAQQRLNEFRANYERAKIEYEELKALLPEQRELTVVLKGVQDHAKKILSLRRFTPKEDTQQDFFTGKPVEVEVTGSYNNLGEFFAKMAAYQRIVSITDFNINRSDNQNKEKSISSQFMLTAYYASAEKLQGAGAKQPGKPGAKPEPKK